MRCLASTLTLTIFLALAAGAQVQSDGSSCGRLRACSPSSARRVLAASAKIFNVQTSLHALSFKAEGIDHTNGVIRILSKEHRRL